MRSSHHPAALFLAALLALCTTRLHPAAGATAPSSGGPTPNGEAVDTFDRTPLMLAAFRGDTAAVQGLLNRGADVNALDKNGMTALMWTAPETAPLLLRSGADVRVRDRFGRTALAFAAHLGDAAMVQALLDRKMDADARDDLGRTPLFYAVEGATRIAFEGRASHEFEIVLFHSRARMRGDGKIPGGDFRGVVRLLLQRGADANARDHAGSTPLLWALGSWTYPVSGAEPLVQALLGAGADINAKDIYGNTALMQQTMWGAAAKFLLAHGADVNAQRNDGWTALMYAAQMGRVDTIKVLLAAGASVNGRNKEGMTALRYAARNGHQDIVKLLKKAGARE